MKARLPYIFEVALTPATSGESPKRIQVGYLDVDISEISRREAKPIARWLISGYRGESHKCALMEWGGRLWMPALRSNWRDLITVRDIPDGSRHQYLEFEAVAPLYDQAVSRPETLHYLSELLKGKDRKFAKSRSETIISSTEDEDATSVRSMANNIVLIGGQAFTRISGLHLKLYTSIWSGHGDWFLSFDYTRNDRKSWMLDRHDDSWGPQPFRVALSELEHAPLFNDEEHNLTFTNLQLDGELPFDGRSMYLARSMAKLVKWNEGEVGGWKVANVERWLAMRDAVERFALNPEPAIDEKAITAMTHLETDHHYSRNMIKSVIETLRVYAQISDRFPKLGRDS
jgi:hypothetical protein